MSDHSESQTSADLNNDFESVLGDDADRSLEFRGADADLRPIPMLIGSVIVALALSGLVDDADVFNHSYWVVPVAALIAACFGVAAVTIRKLLDG